MKSILDPTFVYVPSASTDIRRTFARVRQELAEEKKQQTDAVEKRHKYRPGTAGHCKA